MNTFFPQYPNRSVQLLDGLWSFAWMDDCPDPQAPEWEELHYDEVQAVPGCFDVLPSHPGRRGTGFYRTTVRVDSDKSLLLKIGGLGMWGAIFWDRRLVGFADLPYSGLEFGFSAGAGNVHELVIAIDNRFDFNRQPLLSNNYDFYCHGGIFRSVVLHELPCLAWDRASVRTLDLDWRLHICAQFLGKVPSKLEFTYRLDAEEPQTLSLDVAGNRVEFDAQLANNAPWSPENPALHTIELTLPNGDRLVERFGLRTIAAKNGKILLNGKEIKLHGFCRHESHPEFGPALPLQILLEDLQHLKALHCNFVRGSHYPQDQRFLDLCDESGLLVWEEGLAWGDREEHLLAPNFRSAQKRQLQRMVHNSCNHPAVIIWGILNEGDSTLPAARPLYKELLDGLRQHDSSRLVTYASMFGEKDINLDLADVVSFNTYPAWYAKDMEEPRPLEEIGSRLRSLIEFVRNSKNGDKPIIISEIGAGAIYGWRDRFRCHWSEEYQADFLNEVCNEFVHNDQLAGLALWQFADGRTYSSSRALSRPRAFNNKGIVDEYRRPKLAYDIVQRFYKSL